MGIIHAPDSLVHNSDSDVQVDFEDCGCSLGSDKHMDVHAIPKTSPFQKEEILPGQDFHHHCSGQSQGQSSDPEISSTSLSATENRIDRVVTWDRMLSNICFAGRRNFTAAQYLMLAQDL